MFIIRGDSLYETDNYEQIQEAHEGYLYGSHRGLDIDDKWFKDEEGGYNARTIELYDRMRDVNSIKNGIHKIVK